MLISQYLYGWMRVCALFFLTLYSVHAQESLGIIQTKIVETAHAVQEIEFTISGTQEKLIDRQAKEKKALSQLKEDYKKLFAALHHLRHLNEYSPLLTALSSDNPKDLIHLSMLLRSIVPEVARQHGDILSLLKGIIQTRLEMRQFSADLKKHDVIYKKNMAEITGLMAQKVAFQKKYGLSTAPMSSAKFPAVAPDHQEALIAHIMGQLEHKNDTTVQVGESLRLTQPMVGQYQACSEKFDTDCPNTESILMTSKTPRLVVAPFGGVVVYKGSIQGMGGIVMIKYYDCFLVMTGLDSIVCDMGQTILSGEPVGRFFGGDRGDGKKKKFLSLQLWQKGQPVNSMPLIEKISHVKK